MQLEDSVVVVTGAAGEIGMAITESVLHYGGKVCMVDIKRRKLRKCAEKLFGIYGRDNLTYFDCDVTHTKPFEAAFCHTRYIFGTVDILVNAAAVKNQHDWERNINVNLGGVVNCSKIAGDYYTEYDKAGVVVNVTSAAGVRPEEFTDRPTSVASNAGVVAYTKCLASGLKDVRTLCVCSDDVVAVESRQEEPLRMTGTTMAMSPRDTPDNRFNNFNGVAETFEKLIHAKNNSGSVVVISDDHLIEM